MPRDKIKLDRFRDLQAVYVVGIIRRVRWARNMTDEVKIFVETTSLRVLAFFPSPVRTS